MILRTKAARLGLAALAVAGLAARPAGAQTKPAIVVRAEACLRQNVERVVAAEHDMASAASFLVTYACAGEVAGAARYQRNAAYVQMFSTVFKAAAASPVATTRSGAAGAAAVALPNFDLKAQVDPETGEIVLPPAAPGAPANPMATMLPMMTNIFGQVAPETTPVELRKMAGDLVMAAHERLGSKTR